MLFHRHLHVRKRISKFLEPYPARTALKRLLDKAVYAVGILGPIMTIPQILLIYTNRDASGGAAISWFMWTLFTIPWILYGLVHRERPIVITYLLWFFTNMIVFIGAVLYG
mgnify:FL=1